MAKLISKRGPCPYCGARMTRRGRRGMTRDHVVPKSENGGESLANIVKCCQRCNVDKGHRSIGGWLKDLVRRNDKRAVHVARFIEGRRADRRSVAIPARRQGKSIGVAIALLEEAARRGEGENVRVENPAAVGVGGSAVA